MRTKSEMLFEQYCKEQGYLCNPIPVSSERTPDFEVITKDGKVIVEIKELELTDEDKRHAKELMQKGVTVGGNVPGKRVYDRIRNAAQQLKQYKNQNLPCVLLLYDNIIVDGIRPYHTNYFFDSSFLDFGMYGFQAMTFDVSEQEEGFEIEYLGSKRGKPPND